MGAGVRVAEFGVRDIGRKWLRGICWEEINNEFVLRHATSRDGEIVELQLSEFPTVIAQVMRIPLDERKGPMIVNEKNRLPYTAFEFRRQWRRIADAAGIPKDAKNMDSRAQDDDAN